MKKILETIKTGKEVFLNNLEFTIKILKTQNTYKLTSYDKEIKEKGYDFVSADQLLDP